MDSIEEIKKFKSLLDQGAITQDEFTALKIQLLSKKPESFVQEKSVDTTSSSYDEQKQALGTKPLTNFQNTSYNEDPSEGFDAGIETAKKLFKFSIGLSVLVGIIFWYRYDSFIAFLIVTVVSISVIYNLNKLNNFKQINYILGLIIAVLLILIIIPIGGNSGSSSTNSSANEAATTEPANDDDKFVRDYIISHRYVDVENGVSFTLKFSEENAGWFGIMQMDMGSCWSMYQYETKGRSINLKFDSSNCTSQGDSRTATFNSDNTISFNINGQNFVFQPL